MPVLRSLITKKSTRIIVYILFLFFVSEAALRIQQRIGPLYDLEFDRYQAHLLSYDVNHKPSPASNYTELGIRLNPEGIPYEPDTEAVDTVLFLGDSFMQGLPSGETIPEFIEENYQNGANPIKPVVFLNAGCSSYAPSIYIVQAKQLIPYYRPDFVVVSLDETDMVDDFAVYKPLVQRDSEGGIIAVGPSPIYEIKIMGMISLKKFPFYTFRLLGMFYHKWIRMNWVGKTYRKKEREKYYSHPLADRDYLYSYTLVPAFDEAPDGRNKYLEEITYFDATLRELLATLIELMGSPEKIMVIRHPHLYQLVPDYRGVLWKSYVTEITRKITDEYGVPFYDASKDLKEAFADQPRRFYLPADMHFNAEGLKLYASLIGKNLTQRLEQQAS